MPRIAGTSIPKYRKHRATGQAVVTIGGTDHYLGPHGTKASQLEYDRLIGEWISAGRPSSVATSSDITIAELCQRYKVYAEGYYIHGGTVAQHRDRLPDAAAAIRQHAGGRIRTAGVEGSSPTVRGKWSFPHLLQPAHRHHPPHVQVGIVGQLVPVSTWQALTAVSGLRCGHTEAPENEPIGPIDEATVDATLPHLPDTVAAMVRLQRLTGMRPDEVCRLRPCEVDRSGEVWTFTPSHHKTAHRGRKRTIFIGPQGQEILRPFLPRDAESFCFVPAETVAKQLALRNAKRKTPLSCGNVAPVESHPTKGTTPSRQSTTFTATAVLSIVPAMPPTNWLIKSNRTCAAESDCPAAGHRIGCGIRRQRKSVSGSAWKPHKLCSGTRRERHANLRRARFGQSGGSDS